MDVADNIQRVREVVAEAAGRSGRSPADVRLMAVTKTVDDDRIAERAGSRAGQDIKPARRDYAGAWADLPWHAEAATGEVTVAAPLETMVPRLLRIHRHSEL